MKFKIFSMLVVLGFISVLPMIYMGKFDPMSFFDSIMKGGTSEFQQLKAKAPKGFSNVVTDKKIQVYKWRDEHGVMQFSNVPPSAGGNAEMVELNPNKNIIDAVKIPVKVETKEAAKVEMPNPYSMKGAKKAMKDAKGIEEMLQKRHEEQSKLMDGI